MTLSVRVLWMNRAEVKAELERLEIRPGKKLGQNFLVDSNMLECLVRSAAPRKGEEILEIGPGLGVLTTALVDAGCFVKAVEIDNRFAAYLQEKFEDCSNIDIIAADACKIKTEELFSDRPYRCIANLPYSTASPIIVNLVHAANKPQELFVLLQQEIGERLAAVPNTKAYSALSVQIQLLYEAEKVRKVAPGVFYPSPEVNSAFIRLRQRQTAEAPDKEIFSYTCRLVKTVFTQRRKKLFKILRRDFSSISISKAAEELDISEDARPENITPHQFLKLAALLHEK